MYAITGNGRKNVGTNIMKLILICVFDADKEK